MWARRRTTRSRRILRCPHCHSDRVILEGALITGQVYRCLACDYVGSLVLEMDEPLDPPPDRA
ncbi:MAG TPA: hypothetical protein VEY07_06300 [Thermoplasmata archaeon]|nr:hypothetical protein [Thermoplasmata archaeon]